MASCANCGVEIPGAFRFCPNCGTQRVGDAPGDPLIGRTLGGKFRVLARIGEGSMGTVYRGEHVALMKAIAIKVLRRDLEVGESELRRFQREGIAAGQLSHRNVTQVFDFDRAEDGLVYLAMELVEGKNLAELLRARGPLPVHLAVDLMRQLLVTLVEAHRHGIVHRDLKPENIMVVEGSDAELSIKVLDFGLSKLIDHPVDAAHRSLPGRVVGTPLYMSPEQWRGEEVDSRSDLYSAALILYEMLAGERPFHAQNITEVMVKATSEPPPSLRASRTALAVSTELDQIVTKGLAKNRDERFQTASDMVRALDGVALDAAPRRRPLPLRKFAKPALAVAGVALAAAGIGWLVHHGGATVGAEASLLSARTEAALSPEERRYVEALRNARKLIHDNDLDAARGAVDRALALPCADAEGHVVRGLVDRARRDADVALVDFQKALTLRPGYAAAEAGVGWIAYDRGQFDAADARFDAALHAQADAPEGLAGRGAVLIARGAAAKAVELLDGAAGSHPEDGLVQYWRGRAKLAAGDFAGAVQAFIRATQGEEVAKWQACEGLGDAYLGLGNSDGAERQYEDVLRASPDAHEVRRKLAAALLGEERFDDAMAALRPALQAQPNDPEVCALRGLIEQGRGDAGAAITALETAVAGGAQHLERLHALLANLELQRGRHEEAAKHCEAAAALDDQRDGVFTTWGIALFRLKDYPGAAEKLERAVELAPGDAFAHYCLGIIYRDYLGDGARALSHFEAHKANGGTRPLVDEWIKRLGG